MVIVVVDEDDDLEQGRTIPPPTPSFSVDEEEDCKNGPQNHPKMNGLFK
jgi:hypothetical protein